MFGPNFGTGRDDIDFDTCPVEEQTGETADEQERDAVILIEQLRRQFGQEPDGSRLRIKWNAHDFGSYPSVEIRFYTHIPEAVAYAYRLENHYPTHWDADSCMALGIHYTAEREHGTDEVRRMIRAAEEEDRQTLADGDFEAA